MIDRTKSKRTKNNYVVAESKRPKIVSYTPEFKIGETINVHDEPYVIIGTFTQLSKIFNFLNFSDYNDSSEMTTIYRIFKCNPSRRPSDDIITWLYVPSTFVKLYCSNTNRGKRILKENMELIHVDIFNFFDESMRTRENLEKSKKKYIQMVEPN